MNKTGRWLSILQQMCNLPTAPFAEHAVLQFIRRFAARRRKLAIASDRYGNLLIRYRGRGGPANRPWVFLAHTDHPGFVAERMIGKQRLLARWYGGVEPRYFPGAGVRFYAEGRWLHGRITRVHCSGAGQQRAVTSVQVQLESPRPVPAGTPGMWDLPDAAVRNNKFSARGCDDVAAAAALVCLLDELCRRNVETTTTVAFSRAEEAGFIGAVGMVKSRLIPTGAKVVSLECSDYRAGARLGAGPVLRVGDRVHTFDTHLGKTIELAAAALAKRSKTFRYQRKLMDGGACEATALLEYGFRTAAMCLPLENYHNRDEPPRLAPEKIHVGDFVNLVRLCVELASRADAVYSRQLPVYRRRIEHNFAQHRRLLLSGGVIQRRGGTGS